MARLRRLLWGAAIVAAAGAGAMVLIKGDPPQNRSPSGELLEFRPDFRLSDAAGRSVSVADFKGKFLLVFFGFANCPDICPTTLAEIAGALEILGEDAALVQPLLISVDPERDTPKALAEYVSAFHPSMIGLSGDGEATQKAAESFFVFYEKGPPTPGVAGGYEVSHSSSLFLLGPDGAGVRMFNYGASSAELAADLKPRIRGYKKS